MIAPASPHRLHVAPVSRESLAGEGGFLRAEQGRLASMAGAIFLLTLTAVSGSLLYAFARGPSAPPLVSVSSR